MNNKELKQKFSFNLTGMLIVIFFAIIFFLNSNLILGSLCVGMIPGFTYYMIKYGRMANKCL